jgi:T4-like virus Myoviridae tail sheath stabiliser
LFGTLFNDIVIIRPDAAGKDQIIRVPIEYAPREKMMARLEADPDIDRPYSLLLPRMAFEMTGFNYDGTRKLNTINQVVKKIIGDSNKLNYQYGPVPWNINFSLYVYVRNSEDGLKIVEQILPWFTPAWTTTVEIIPEMDESRDIPIVITGTTQEDRYSGDFKTRRMLIWTLTFQLKGYLYGPVKKTGIIKIANTSFYIANTTPIRDSVGHVDIAERLIIRPGMDANGHPLHYDGPAPIPDTVLTVPITQIDANSDFGYLETYESVPIGVPRPMEGANVAVTDAQRILEEDETD